MRVTVEKLPGVESAAVSLNEGRMVVQLRPGNATTMAQVRQSIERNGFTPQQAAISARAEVAATGGKLQVKISGTNETYDIASTAHADGIQQQLKKHIGQAVLIEGIVAPVPKGARATPVIQVNSVKPATDR